MDKGEEELVFLSAAVMSMCTSLQIPACGTKSSFLHVTFEDYARATTDVLESKTVPLGLI